MMAGGDDQLTPVQSRLGFAGAIVGRGRDDRSLFANALIGVAGAVIGGLVWYLAVGEEFSFGAGGLPAALFSAILFLLCHRRALIGLCESMDHPASLIRLVGHDA